MISILLQYNYALVDNIIVGRYVSTDALAAVGNVGSINGFVIGTALDLTSGFTIPVAHAFSAKKSYNRIILSVNKILILDIIVSIFMSITLMLIAEPMVSLFMTEKTQKL